MSERKEAQQDTAGHLKSPRIARIGSCFAASLAAEIAKAAGGRQVGSLVHLRSDALVQSSIEQLWAFPSYEALDAFAGRHGRTDLLEVNRGRLQCQSREVVAKFEDAINATDIILVDNHYDIASDLYLGDEYVGEHVRLKLLAAPHYRDRRLPALTPEESTTNILRLMTRLRSLAPNASVVFTPVPRSAVAAHADRHGVFGEYLAGFDATTLPEGCYILPKMEFAEDLHDLDHGNFYFKPPVYKAYAQLIRDLLNGQQETALASTTRRLSELSGKHGGDRPKKPDAETTQIHPYSNLPDRAYWRLSVADRTAQTITDLYRKRFTITPEDKIATFGSCFAQHIGARLKSAKFNFVEFERRPRGLPKADAHARGYGIYSARYGNIYTPRQLLQLFLRAFGRFKPVEDYWEEDGRYFDPFRPTIEESGFSSLAELVAAREAHFRSVRRLFREANVIFFTFGLTETWVDARDGAAYPVCPGTAHGRFDSAIHEFRNFNVIEIRDDFAKLVARVKAINPGVRFVTTVSPVPLVATASGQHVLVATMHSKSILRAACSLLFDAHDNIDYFPSYEIIASHPYRAMFYDSNLRTVTSAGVEHVMRQFFQRHDVGKQGDDAEEEDLDLEAVCDEVLLDSGM